MIRQGLLLLALTLLLGGCGSSPPAPVDRFYRLQPSALPAAATLPATLEIRNVRGDSLYAERPIVFSDAADARQLRQYHYHLWLYPPAQMVRDHFRASLAGAGNAGSGGKPSLSLDARIVSFERVLSGKASTAQVALEVTVLSGEKPLLSKQYSAAQAAGDDSFSAFSAAMELALNRIYGEVLGDIGRLDLKPR
ncbi:MAG: cholesterol transport system auxiliary component [Pseudomonadota bacterium]|nr:cholesterol transport system auxiliary component [Pseudomonadota bacterium]